MSRKGEVLSGEPKDHLGSSLGTLAPKHQVTVGVLENRSTPGRFHRLSFVAEALGRFSSEDNKWLTIALVWEVLCCPGTLP